MKKMFFAGVSAVALFAAASIMPVSAADIYRGDAAQGLKDGPALMPVAKWEGLYLGAHAGYGWGSADISIPNYHSVFTLDSDGFVGGGHLGYNFQRGNVVFGIEGDFSGSEVGGDHLSGLRAEKYNIDENWRASLRGRLGYAVAPGMLLFATGGAAWANIDTHYTPLAGGTKSETLEGWIVGGGFERMVTQNWSLRGEYLHAEYDTNRFVHNGPSDVSYQTDEVRAGVTYHLSRGYEALK